LERDDGTVLQTHTLADGETSFTFTQTETSYATFNYVVKINGTQTDTYSATYNPPPTPTFDIALTNDDLAITATLTNIVNPDPYYTLMIHDANDTHLDGHTFATGDTTVVLTWTESTYGEKTYTKLLNGASIGTETITLTDPNASTSTVFPSQINITGGAWANNIFNLDVSKSTTTSKYYELNTYTNNGFEFRNEAGNTVVYPNTDDNTGQPNYVSFSNPITSDSRFGVSSIESLTLTSSDVGSTLHLYASHDNSLWMSFVISADLIYSLSSTSTSTPPTPEATIYPTSGAWNNQHYFVYEGDIVQNGTTYFHYSLDFQPGNHISGYSILYDYTSKIWKDGDDASPFYLHSSVPLAGTSFTITNPAHLHGFDTNSTEYFGFPNPYYEAIEPQTITPTSVNPAWGGATYIWIQTVGTSEIYTLAFGGVATNNNHEIQVDTNTNTWSDYGTNNPNTVTDNGSTVTLSSGTTTFVVFNKPTSASWL